MKPGVAERYWRSLRGAQRVLDLGCGAGDFGRYCPENVTVHGVDSDPSAIERAAAFEIALCVDLESEALPYPDEFFDAVLAKDILEHLVRPEYVLREIYRVLRPDGRLLASVVVANPRRVWADYTHIRGYTPQAATLLLEDAGFSVEAVWGMGGIPLSHRLRLMSAVPWILKLPIAKSLWLSSWELIALRGK